MIPSMILSADKPTKRTRPVRPVIIETERLLIREIVHADFTAMRAILQDGETMRYHNGALSYWEALAWCRKQRWRYRKYGFGLWAVVLKETGEVIGQCGVTFQHYMTHLVPGIGYLLNKAHWHRGYATEAAVACKEFAFDVLKLKKVYSIINVSNEASRRVAERIDMTIEDCFSKSYGGVDMDLYLYSTDKC